MPLKCHVIHRYSTENKHIFPPSYSLTQSVANSKQVVTMRKKESARQIESKQIGIYLFTFTRREQHVASGLLDAGVTSSTITYKQPSPLTASGSKADLSLTTAAGLQLLRNKSLTFFCLIFPTRSVQVDQFKPLQTQGVLFIFMLKIEWISAFKHLN